MNPKSCIKKIIRKLRLNILFYALCSLFLHEKYDEDAVQARKKLNDFSPCPKSSSLTQNQLDKSFKYDLQIIVPAYNVEKYLQECMDSILSQETTYSYIVFLIDDGSTDQTSQIVDTYASDPRVVVIHQENKGFSGARNTGLKTIVGQYIMFVDSDDLLPQGAIQSLVQFAEQNDAEIVEGGVYRRTQAGDFIYKQHKQNRKVQALGILHGVPWGKIYKSTIWENLQFPVNYWYEDSINSFLIYPQIKRAFIIPDMVYIYRRNLSSITYTSVSKPKSIDTFWITELMMKEHDILNLPYDKAYFEKFFRQVILNAKRIDNMPEHIQQAVFVLTVDLYNSHFSNMDTGKYKALQKALKNYDYGQYKLYIKSH